MAKVDMLSYLSHTTLDIIGLAGFNYTFDSLTGRTNELSSALEKVLTTTGGFPICQVLKAEFPILRPFLNFDERSRETDQASKTFMKVGSKIIAAERERIKQEQNEYEGGDEENPKNMGKNRSKDLLSVILRTAVGNGSDAVTDQDALKQIPTFIMAGTSFFTFPYLLLRLLFFYLYLRALRIRQGMKRLQLPQPGPSSH